MNPEIFISHSRDLEFSRLDEAYLAIDAPQNYCYSLNATAGRIWDMTVEPLSLAEICRRLQNEYAIDEETCRRDVTALVNELQDAGLLRTSSQNPGEQV